MRKNICCKPDKAEFNTSTIQTTVQNQERLHLFIWYTIHPKFSKLGQNLKLLSAFQFTLNFLSALFVTAWNMYTFFVIGMQL